MIKSAISLLLVFVCCKAQAQELSKDQVSEDLSYLIQSIENYNPALDIYNPNFKQEASKLVSAVEGPLSLLDYFSLVSQICALSNEGHFSVGNWEDQVHKGIPNNTYAFLPMTVYILDGKVYCEDTYAETREIAPFSEIISINGTTTDQFLKQIYQHLSSDGTIQSNLEAKAQSGFSWMHYLFVEQPDKYEVLYADAGTNQHKRVVLPALIRSKQVEFFRSRQTSQDTENTEKVTAKQEPLADFYTFKIEEGYAYLKLKSFDFRLVNKYELEAQEFYENLFKQISSSDIDNLIIDLRGNTGGRNEFADELIPFIMKQPTGDFMKKSISWRGKTKTYKTPKASQLAFDGQLYVLTDGLTYSAGATLSRYLKEYGNATFIGQETGSRYEGYAAGSSQSITLTHGNITIGIPRYHIFHSPSTKQKTANRGLIPDYEVIPSIEDLKHKKDPVLEKARALIQQ